MGFPCARAVMNGVCIERKREGRDSEAALIGLSGARTIYILYSVPVAVVGSVVMEVTSRI